MKSVVCRHCGTVNSEFNETCVHCGSELPLSSSPGSQTIAPETRDSLQDNPLTGRQLGHYEVLREIGAGGMGRVYAARDSKLGRVVALKVLPPQFAADPARLQGFRGEARAVAALNHPNIVTLHSVEEADGLHFLTMELIEGRRLREVIPEHGMSLHRIIDLSLSLLDALRAAHGSQILHQDLKPSNIMISNAGHLKILDFGLSRFGTDQDRVAAAAMNGVAEPLQPDDDPAQSSSGPLPRADHRSTNSDGHDALADTPVSALGPSAEVSLSDPPTETLTIHGDSLTLGGHLLGTLPYIAPELLRGAPSDQRSDLFSLGVVLFEISTGKRPFRGSGAALVNAILSPSRLAISAFRPDLPPRLSAIVGRLLANNPERRFATAEEVRQEFLALRAELAATIQVDSTALPSLPESTHQRRSQRRLGILSVALILLTGFWWLTLQNQTARTALTPAPAMSVLVAWPGVERRGRFSPGDRRVAFIAERDGRSKLWVKPLPSGNERPVTSRDPVTILDLAWAVDGKQIALLEKERASATLSVVSIQTRFVKRLPTPSWLTPAHRLSRWIGSRLYLHDAQGVWQLDLASGQSRQIVVSEPGRELRGLDIDPTGQLLVACFLEGGKMDLFYRSIDATEWTRLTQDGGEKEEPRWVGADVRRILFIERQTGADYVALISRDTGARTRLFGDFSDLQLDDLSADGALAVCTKATSTSQVYRSDGAPRDAQRTPGAAIDVVGANKEIIYSRRETGLDLVILRLGRPRPEAGKH